MKKNLTEQKRVLFEEWAENDHVLVHLDSRNEDVIVPSHLKDQHSLTLKMSYLFQGETKCDNDGISSYLKFSGEYFQCILPWDSVWGLTSDQGVQKLWKESMPKELLEDVAKMMLSSVGSKIKEVFTKSTDKSEPEEKSDKSDKSDSEEKTSDTAKRKPLLKRIK